MGLRHLDILRQDLKVALRTIRRTPSLSITVVRVTAIGIAVLSGLLAGFYPTWRVCRVQPAAYLKTQ